MKLCQFNDEFHTSIKLDDGVAQVIAKLWVINIDADFSGNPGDFHVLIDEIFGDLGMLLLRHGDLMFNDYRSANIRRKGDIEKIIHDAPVYLAFDIAFSILNEALDGIIDRPPLNNFLSAIVEIKTGGVKSGVNFFQALGLSDLSCLGEL